MQHGNADINAMSIIVIRNPESVLDQYCLVSESPHTAAQVQADGAQVLRKRGFGVRAEQAASLSLANLHARHGRRLRNLRVLY